MNCILQSFAHTPMLRNYFLSDCHYCPDEESQNCLVCEMSNLFQEVSILFSQVYFLFIHWIVVYIWIFPFLILRFIEKCNK